MPSVARLFQPAGLVLMCLAMAGCGRSGPKTYPVTGKVTLDGQPLVDGYITFEPVDDDISPDAGKISAGEFSFRAKAGNKRVTIVANRVAPGAAIDPVMGAAPLEQYIPAQYNTESTLSANVDPDGDNHYEFPLKSRP